MKQDAIEMELTPPNQSKSPQILSVREEGHEDEAVEVETLNKDPVVIGCQEVHEQGHNHLAANLYTISKQREQRIRKLHDSKREHTTMMLSSFM